MIEINRETMREELLQRLISIFSLPETRFAVIKRLYIPKASDREALKDLEEERKIHPAGGRTAAPKGTASNEMCTFLILNISSLQLIPVNIIAYRSQYGSVNPAAVIAPSIAATLLSAAAAVVFCKVMDGRTKMWKQ